MPTYDYVCDACEHKFELYQQITAKPVRKCPECGKLKVRRLIGTGAGIIFKGSGFYCTDYRDKTYTTAAKKDQPQSSSTSSASTDSGTKKDSSSTPKGGGKSSGDKAK